MTAHRHPILRWIAPAAILCVVMALIIAVVVLRPGARDEAADPTKPAGTEASGPTASSDAEQPLPTELAVPDLSGQERRQEGDPHAQGPVDAPVVLVVFSDYQCKHCAQWHTKTLPAMQKYIQEGKLRVEWRDVYVFGEPSHRAARAVVAAGEQGKLHEYQAALFEGGKVRSADTFTDEGLTALAVELGLDREKFVADLNSEKTWGVVQQNAEMGAKLGVMSTPAFIVGGRPLVGAQPTEVFTAAVEDALAKAKNGG